MRKYIFLLAYVFVCMRLNAQADLTIDQANWLAALPMKCMQQQYPNKLSQLLNDPSELLSPKQLHPAFYGCFDWHSSVHGHWSLGYLLNKFPALQNRDSVIQKLATNLSKENIDAEVVYLSKKHEKSFERTYGWAWVLKLQQALDESKDSYAKPLARNLQPLTDLLVQRYIEFLPKLLYPLRIGTHANTAFGLSFAYDYAVHTHNIPLKESIAVNAKRYFLKDAGCPLNWEPSGTDFLSPCMEEINLMEKVLPANEFIAWAKKFAPQLFNKKFDWEVAKVSDREDGHLVHLDGLNFSRAWCFFLLAKKFPAQLGHLKALGEKHFNYSIGSITDGNYEGEHWLASFALHTYEVSMP
ncbi:DUF2891 domain-containing protein [Ferruginibacter sp. HRS2-29]|uniref:DUF2891 domain-containing protein n=1 Tax=Ferruginibacter sp. HRS2-29 TaxID=2487334 RepID=UPI0020CE7714|nr:DUF2891 domain-containing protein [Ferruginibacter sp. HRS2-29]MCP9752299.1 DUF2891 domain-containing protein [Ferruginibacter sp. HRS2-29]